MTAITPGPSRQEERKERRLTTPLIAFRFPSGTEFRTTDAPEVGDVLTNDGQEWVVVEVTTDGENLSVVLHPVEKAAEPGAA